MRVGRLMAMSIAAASGVACVASEAIAHPGHGLDSGGTGLLHYLLDLSHGGGLALLAIACLAVVAVAIAEARYSGHR